MSDWIVSFVARYGALGVFSLMLAENVVPPIPSELIMPLAGYHGRTGSLNLVAAVLFGSLGSLAGTTLWYLLGRRVGEQTLRDWIARRGRWLAITPRDLDTAMAWFERRGAAAVFVCRMIPALRTVISLPAGLCGMRFSTFLLYSSVGTVIWTAALAYAGYVLGEQYERVEAYLGPISWIVIGTAVGIYVWRIIRQTWAPAS